jgi:capsular exopolysaccharide synthesis family protein
MSRIDEALKRASGLEGDHHLQDESSELSTDRHGRTSIDQYPREGRVRRSETARPARVDLTAATSIAAPRTGSRKQFVGTNPRLEGKVVVNGQAAPVAVEQYRRLAASLHGLQAERGLKTLMVTSTVPQEGKTLTVANLALTLSESYRQRVLLIDADLRRPAIHEVFELPNATGLGEGLRAERGHLPILEVSQFLSVVPAGHPDANPMAKLTSERMQILLDEASATFDWILLDAPPVGMMPDAHLLARLTHAVLFVIAAGSTPYDLVERALDDLGRGSIIGIVLNRVSDYAMPDAGYYEPDRYRHS